jgi:hypothetical protein
MSERHIAEGAIDRRGLAKLADGGFPPGRPA